MKFTLIVLALIIFLCPQPVLPHDFLLNDSVA